MSAPEQKRTTSGFARVVGLIGAAIFLLGGKFLYEIKHISFFVAEAYGIATGLLVMLVGGAIEMLRKPRP